MASQLEQLLGYLDRPGVTEVALSPGKPITMTTPKGVMNVTGRSLTADQLASIVRVTPLELLVDAATPGTTPVTVGKREVEVVIERNADALTVRLRRVIPKTPAPAQPRTRTRSQPPIATADSDGIPRPRAQTSPPSDKLKAPALAAPRLSDADIPIDLDLEPSSDIDADDRFAVEPTRSSPHVGARLHPSSTAPTNVASHHIDPATPASRSHAPSVAPTNAASRSHAPSVAPTNAASRSHAPSVTPTNATSSHQAPIAASTNAQRAHSPSAAPPTADTPRTQSPTGAPMTGAARPHSASTAPTNDTPRPRTPSFGGHPNDMRPRSPSMSPFAGVPTPSTPAMSTSALAGLPPSTAPTSTSALAGLPPSSGQPTSASALAGLPTPGTASSSTSALAGLPTPGTASSSTSALAGLPPTSAQPTSASLFAGLPSAGTASASTSAHAGHPPSNAPSTSAQAELRPSGALATSASALAGLPPSNVPSASTSAPNGTLMLAGLPLPARPSASVPVPARTISPAGPPGLALDLELDGEATLQLPALPPEGTDIPLPPPRTMPRLKIDVSSGATAPRDAGSASGERQRTTPPARAAHGSVSTGRTLEALGLPSELGLLIRRERSLVLVAAPRGHGKTSTVTTLGDVVDRSAGLHVVVIDELRDAASIDMAISAAESGYLVLATVPAESVAAGLEHIVRRYAEGGLGPVRNRLLDVLTVAIGKRLPPAASEIVVGDALRTLLGA